jgi:hypothetical protein
MERWRTVAGYEGLYEISDLGNVRSLHRSYKPRLRGDLLTPGVSCGKMTVVLYKDGGRKTRLVHHLVLDAFTGPCPPGEEARHGPGGALDNRLVNLCWGTHAENEADRVRDGTSNRGERQWQARLTREQVMECRRRYAAGESQGVLAAEFGVSGPTVSNAITGETWSWLPGAVPVDHTRHGRRGTAHHSAKLTPEIVAAAKRRSSAGEYISVLATEYGVTQATMWKAIRGWTWKPQP